MLTRKSCSIVERDKERPIKVYARVRPLGAEEIERNEAVAIETFDDAKRIKIIDTKHSQETTYHFDGVFTGKDANEKVFKYTAKHLTVKLLNGMNCAVLAYGQTGSGKTFTLMADGCITESVIIDLYRMVDADHLHSYKINCSFVQIYLEKVYDLLSVENKDELPVREHPTKGIYVKDLSHHRVYSSNDILVLFRRGKQELITAETRMVRHSSRSHSIFQISIERRLDVTKKQELLKEIEPELAETVMLENIPNDIVLLEEEMVLRGKMDICDLAGSERLGKTMVEGINRSEAKYINSSLLQLGNVIYALSEGKRRHIPFRNSTLTRLLQECLGSKCITSFIICAAPSASEAYETRCSLNFGTRARTITNKERMLMNVEVDYKLLTKRLSKRIFQLESELNRKLDAMEHEEDMSNPDVGTQTDFIEEETKLKMESITSFTENVKYLLNISEMLEMLIEGGNDHHTSANNFEQHKESDFRNISILTIAKEQVSNILAELPEQVVLKNGYSNINLVEFITQCSQILETFQGEMLISADTEESKRDFIAETAFTIFDFCGDTKNMIRTIAKGNISNSQLEQWSEESSDIDGWPAEIKYTLENFVNEEDDTGNEEQVTNVRYIYYLANLLQIFQVVRLFLEDLRHKNEAKAIPKLPMKPFKWSTSVEDVTSSDVGHNSIEDMDFTDDDDGSSSETETSSGFKQMKEDQRKHKIDFSEKGKGGDPERKNFRSKLSRSYSIKVKKEEHHRRDSISSRTDNMLLPPDFMDEPSSIPPSLSRSRTFDTITTRNKRFNAAVDDGDRSMSSFYSEMDNDLNLRITDIQQKHDELWEKYKKVVQENGSMISKIKSLEQEKTQFKTERDYFQNQMQTCYENIKEKEEEINKIQQEYTQIKMKLQVSEEKIFENKQNVNRLESLLEEKENTIKAMKTESKAMSNKIEAYTKNEKVLKELKREMEKGGVRYQQCKDQFKAFSEEILSVSSIIDIVKFQESRRQTMSNIEDITSLESEFFNALECNVQYEAALCDVRYKVRTYLLNECGINHFPNETTAPRPEPIVTIKHHPTNTKSPIASINSSSNNAPSSKPAPDLKRSTSIKCKQKKRLSDLRKNCCDKPVSAAKEIKACRASRIKELLHEKVKLNDRIDKLEKEVQTKDVEVRQSQGQIDVLIKELGNLDLELNTKPTDDIFDGSPSLSSRDLTSASDPIMKGGFEKELNFMDISCLVSQDKNLELIGIPEINYKEFMAYVNSISNNKSNGGGEKLQSNMDEEMVSVKELTALQDELELYKGKYQDLDTMYKKLKKKIDQDELATENQSLQRRLEYLQHSNSILDEENQSIKSVIRDRKTQIKDLRQRNIKLTEELESYKHQYMTTKAKGDTTKLQLEKKLSISKEKMISLENYIKQLTSELQAVKRKRKKSFNDSGLPNDDSDS